jgi:hypothetical protein
MWLTIPHNLFETIGAYSQSVFSQILGILIILAGISIALSLFYRIIEGFKDAFKHHKQNRIQAYRYMGYLKKGWSFRPHKPIK